MLGMRRFYEANMAMHNADVILAVGARFDDRVTNTPSKFCPGAKMVVIDIDPASISKTIAADVPIVGPCDSVLGDMLELMANCGGMAAMSTRPDTDILVAADRRLARSRRFVDETTLRHRHQYQWGKEAIEALYRITKGGTVTSDVGQHQMFAAQYYRFNKPRRWINSGGLGTMGFGLPAAMGVKLAFPDADVACVTGEGSSR